MRALLEKNPGLVHELELADPRLGVLVRYVAAVMAERYDVVPTLTRVNGSRSQTIALHGAGSPASVHEVRPCRGADVRTRGVLTDEQAQELEDLLRGTIQYSAPGSRVVHHCATFETQEKMVALGRDPKLPALTPHLHLQVPPWTSTGSAPMVRLWTLGPGA